MARACQIVRVFTTGADGGNHLGVVTDIVGLDAGAMQAIATDLGYSETVFIDWAGPSSVPGVRIFTPAMELPFAGHPLVGAAWVLSRLGPGAGSRLSCPAGVVEYRSEGAETWIDASAVPVDVAELDGAEDFIARAGLAAPDRIWRLLLPKEYVVAEFFDRDAVTEARPAREVLAERFGTLIFHRDGDAVRARFFAPSAGVDEDPATGSAAVALASALRHAGETDGAVRIAQGAEIGHPSQIGLRWDEASVSIGGTVVRDEARFIDP